MRNGLPLLLKLQTDSLTSLENLKNKTLFMIQDMNLKKISVDGIKKGGLIRGSKIAAASLLAGAILSCGPNLPTVNPTQVLEEVVAEKVHEPAYSTQTVNPARVTEEVQVIPEDEPAYVREELHEAYGVPHPRDMVARTMEGDLDYMTVVHDDDLNPHDAINLTFGALFMHEYVKQLGMPEIDADVKIYIYGFPPEIRGKKGGVESIASVPKPCGYNSDASGLEIFLNGDSNSQLWPYAIAHELVHVYQNLLSQEAKCSDVPTWLNEGSADFLSVRAIMEGLKEHSDSIERYETNHQTYDQFRANRATALLKDSDLSLEFFEHNLGLGSYDYGILAAEYLASIAGESSILGFYGSLQPDKPWQESFQEAFGLESGEFYNRFEEHQNKGFPKLDIQKGEPYVHEQSLKE